MPSITSELAWDKARVRANHLDAKHLPFGWTKLARGRFVSLKRSKGNATTASWRSYTGTGDPESERNHEGATMTAERNSTPTTPDGHWASKTRSFIIQTLSLVGRRPPPLRIKPAAHPQHNVLLRSQTYRVSTLKPCIPGEIRKPEKRALAGDYPKASQTG